MVLFVASEAGSAQYLSKIIKKFEGKYSCISSEVSKKIFDENGIKNSLITPRRQTDKIDLIVTGTCWENGIDKEYLKFAIEKKILCISIVEHWSWYKKRFLQSSQLILPDYILVNDSLAIEEASRDSLPKEKLISLGNPVLEELSKKKINPINKIEWLKILEIPRGTQIITFISENIQIDSPLKSPNCQGFNEYQVVEDIYSVISNNQHLIIKLHPAEKNEKYSKYNKLKNVSIVESTDVDSIIINSDFIIGMGSMFLLEAAIFRNDIISYRPNEKKEFIGNKIKATYIVKRKSELKKIFDNKIIIKNKKIRNNFIGSTNRIIDFIKDKIQ